MARAHQLGVAAALLASLLLAGLGLGWLRSRGPRVPRSALLRVGFAGLGLGVLVLFFERWGLELVGRGGRAEVPLYLTLGLWGPLGEGAKLAALWPAFTRRELRGPLEAVTAAALVSSIFALLREGDALATYPEPSWVFLVAQALTMPTQMLLSSPWAFVLGRSYLRSNPRSGFLPSWLAAVVFHGVSSFLLASGKPAGLVASGALLLGLLLLAFLVRDSLRPGATRLALRRTRTALPGVDLRELLARKDAPLSLRWVLLGVLVHQGALLLSLVGAVALGNYLGVDFPSVDATENASVGPVVFLVGLGLLSFPLSGFLMTRASEISTFLEPALASVLALVGLAVVMGVAAPLVLAVVIACAPVALALSCAGAWLALRSLDRYPDAERRPALRGEGFDAPPVCLRDGLHRRQPEARAAVLAGDQRVEERGPGCLGDPRAVVLDEYLDKSFVKAHGGPEGAVLLASLGLDGVEVEVGEGLGEEERVAAEGEALRGHGLDQADRGRAGGQLPDEGQHLGGSAGGARQGFPPGQGEEGGGDVLGAGEHGGGFLQVPEEPRLVAAVPPGEVEGRGDHRQQVPRLVEGPGAQGSGAHQAEEARIPGAEGRHGVRRLRGSGGTLRGRAASGS